MTTAADNRSSFLLSSILGIVRGVAVHTSIYPLEVVKSHLQVSKEPIRTLEAVQAILQKGGFKAFYQGVRVQLLKTSLKQAWCWPVITEVPHLLKDQKVDKRYHTVLTGEAIATVDALVTHPLEKAKFKEIFNESQKKLLFNAYKQSWQGLLTYWTHRSVAWISFLTAQQYFRDQLKQEDPTQKLTLPQLVQVGLKVAVVVSLALAPFDVANTRKQARNLSPQVLLSKKAIPMLYRGWHINLVSLAVHNIASVVLIDQLQ